MSAIDSIQSTLERYLGPLANKLSSNKGIQAISSGMMGTMPVVIGIAFIAIFINLPIDALTEFLSSSGLYAVGNMVMTVTMSMLAIYMTVTIAYRFGTSLGINGVTAAVFTMGVFLVLMPLQIVTDGDTTSMYISPSYLGSNGIFMALLLGLLVPWVVSKLMRRFEFKLPDSVPSMVSDSLSPSFVAIIVFTACFFVKWAFTLTPWGNVFDMIITIVGTPIMNIGSSVWAPVIVQTLAMVLWFFGIHPSAVTNVYNVVVTACTTANLEAFIAGDPLPYLEWQIVQTILNTGFTAEGLPLAVSMLFARSERYKATSRLAIVPAIFNITEPMMFGVPVVMNPVFAIPMVTIKAIVGVVTILLTNLGLVTTLNPAVSLTWIMPFPITAFLMGGVGFLLVALIGFAISFCVFLPFFRMADNMALREEQEAAAAKAAEKDAEGAGAAAAEG